jgi:hypothetical protein
VGRPTHGGRMDFQPLSRNAGARVAGQVRVLTT